MKSRAPTLANIIQLVPGYDPVATAGECWFEPDAAQHAIDFFHDCLTHVEGELAGQPFKLELWEQAIVANLFGWKKRDRYGRVVRRYREMLLYIPRKNGKTPLVAGIALYVFFCEPEAAQQNYLAAADREEASALFRHARGMVENEPELRSRCEIYGGDAGGSQTRSLVREDGSFMRVISGRPKHGGNTHLGVVDELHTQPNRDLVDVIRTSMASKNRAQPLLLLITTADFQRPSICNEVHGYASKVRDGIIRDERFLPVIYEAAIDADLADPAIMRRANPNLGISVSEDYLVEQLQIAQENPSYLNTVKRLHYNITTEQAVTWLDMEKWELCGAPLDEASLVGRPCFSGVDLSSKIDITAHVLAFPPCEGDPKWRLLARFWIPEENAHARERRDRVPYTVWAREGFISTTPGNVIDYDFVKAGILADYQRFQIVKTAFDPFCAAQIMIQLAAEGVQTVEFRQGFMSMSEPSKELERLVVSEAIGHGGNPVLCWMASNAAKEEDAAGNIKPSKRRSTEKVDGIFAAVMAIGLAIAEPPKAEPSIDVWKW